MAYSIVNASALYSVSGSSDDDGFTFSVDTSAWAAGSYTWAESATLAGARLTICTGLVVVKADPTAGAVELRSFARQMLDAIEAAMIGAATESQLDLLSSSLKDRSIARDREKLLVFRDKFRREVASEDAAAGLAAGLGAGNRVLVRF